MKLLVCWPSCSFSIFDVAHGVRAGLVEEGHSVFDYRLYQRIMLMQQAFRSWNPQQLEGEPDMEMVCLHASEALPYTAVLHGCRWILVVAGMGLHPNALHVCRKVGLKVALWLTEAPYNTNEEQELYLARFADLVFVNERTSVGDVQRAVDQAGQGGRALYLPHAYNPAVHKPGEADPKHKADVLLVGTGFAERQALLEAIDWTGIDLKLGGLWTGIEAPSMLAPHVVYPCLDNGDVVKLYHGAKIVINPHRRAVGAESANPRTYEVAACGAFQLADYRAEIAEVFGESVPTWEPDVPWQLAGLIRRYLADDGERRRLSSLAMERVQEQTFRVRAQTIIEAIEEWERDHSSLRVLAGR